MTNIWNIAVGMYKEMSRNKVFYVAVVFCIALVAVAALYRTVSIGEELTLMRDTGLAAIHVLGVLIAIFAASASVSKEFDTRAIQVLLAKPVSKEEFILGKYLGTVLIVFLNVALMTAGLFFVLLLKTRLFNFGLYRAIVPLCFEFAVLGAVSILFSVMFKGILAPILSMAVFALGHVTQLLPYLMERANSVVAKVITGIVYYVLPNLRYFNLKGQAAPGLRVPANLMGGIILYAGLYITMVLIVSMLIFRKKEVALT